MSLPVRLAPLWLASASPRRTDLLAAAGWEHQVVPVTVDETPRPGEPPLETCRRLAEDKARAGARGRATGTALGSDTLVVLDGEVLGKPADAAEARRMLAALAGRRHSVATAVALVSVADGRCESGVDVSEVAFDPLDDATLSAYLAGGEWRGKAGAYAIQGDASAFAHLRTGALDTVIGLSMGLVATLAAQLADGR